MISTLTGNVNLADPLGSGTLKTRKSYLEGLRATDPARARKLIEAAWGTCDAKTRNAYLNALLNNLSMDDEPFLESVLDNKARSVQANAASLLSALADSRLVQRMTTFAVAHLDYLIHLRPGRPDQLVVTLPELYTPGIKRDPIAEKASFPVVNDPFSWLSQAISRVPPRTWTQRWRKTPQQVLQAALNTPTYGEALATAFINATVLHHDPDWAESLLVYNLESLTSYTPQYLITFVPLKRREQVVEKALTNQPDINPVRGLPPYFFWWLEKPWSVHFSRLILDRLVHYADPATSEDHSILPTIRLFAEGMHPSLYDEARARLGPPNPIHPYLADSINTFLATLTIYTSLRSQRNRQ